VNGFAKFKRPVTFATRNYAQFNPTVPLSHALYVGHDMEFTTTHRQTTEIPEMRKVPRIVYHHILFRKFFPGKTFWIQSSLV
jgi:hypothetical protein